MAQVAELQAGKYPSVERRAKVRQQHRLWSKSELRKSSIWTQWWRSTLDNKIL